MKTLSTITQRSLLICLVLSILLPLNLRAQSVAEQTVTAQTVPANPTEGAWDLRFSSLGVEGEITALAITANGDLYAGGNFLKAGGIEAKYIAR